MRNRILSQLEDSVRVFVSEYPNATYDRIVKRFGAPQQVAATYINEMDPLEIAKELADRKCIVLIFSIAAITAILMWAGVVSAAYLEYQNSANGYMGDDRIIDVTYFPSTEGK